MIHFSEKEFENAESSDLLAFKCDKCGEVFYKTKTQFIKNRKNGFKFCSKKCLSDNFSKKITTSCCNCGKIIEKTNSEFKKSESGNTFCSYSCSASFNNRLNPKRKKNSYTNKKEYNVKGITESEIEIIKFFKEEFKTFDEIKNLVDLPNDKILKVIRILKDDKEKLILKTDEIVSHYKISKSLNETSLYFNITKGSLKKILGEDLINEIKNSKRTRSENVINWRNDKKEKLVEYKGGKCEICGYNKCLSALQFHHKNPEEKEFGLSKKTYSFDKLKEEADKCILLCANCHAEIHNKINEEKNKKINVETKESLIFVEFHNSQSLKKKFKLL